MDDRPNGAGVCDRNVRFVSIQMGAKKRRPFYFSGSKRQIRSDNFSEYTEKGSWFVDSLIFEFKNSKMGSRPGGGTGIRSGLMDCTSLPYGI